MQTVITNFSLFNFYNYNKGIDTLWKAREAMTLYINSIAQTAGHLRIELSRSTDSGLTIGLIIEYLSKDYDITVTADERQEIAVLYLDKKEDEQ